MFLADCYLISDENKYQEGSGGGVDVTLNLAILRRHHRLILPAFRTSWNAA